jgi:hypothetical protein
MRIRGGFTEYLLESQRIFPCTGAVNDGVPVKTIVAKPLTKNGYPN